MIDPSDIPAGFKAKPAPSLAIRDGKPYAECFVPSCRRPWCEGGAFCLDHWLAIPDRLQARLNAHLTPAWRDRLDRRNGNRAKCPYRWTLVATAALVLLERDPPKAPRPAQDLLGDLDVSRRRRR